MEDRMEDTRDMRRGWGRGPIRWSPPAVKSVYFALTEVTNAGKLVIAPQCRTTSGGLGFF